MNGEIPKEEKQITEAQIIVILRQAWGGAKVAEFCRELGKSNAWFYKWRARYGRILAFLISQMKAIEDENWRQRGILSP